MKLQNASMIYDIVIRHGARAVVVNPIRIKAIVEAKTKTDKVDAETLARISAADFAYPCWVARQEEMELRNLLHH